MKATLRFTPEEVIGEIDNRLYGSFLEHLGRAIYGGIYEPTHPTADENGFRQDVLEMVRTLGVPLVRYPGGNFVSGYNWEDGIGEKSKRPMKMELAWKSIETNQVGIDEFQAWCKLAGAEVMLAVNLGTRGADEARNLVEYCNSTTNTYYANLRRNNGFEQPFGVKLWCLGNEMDGPWQICAKTPTEYARLACETAKVMKWVDPTIELVAAGSSNSGMATFGEWEETVLRNCYPYIDYLSLHTYYGNYKDDSADFLASSLDMDAFIERVVTICDNVQAELQSDKQINLSFDEWNVWYHSNIAPKTIPDWSVAPPILEDIYTLEDAVVAGTMLISLLNHADRVKIACLAQLVNAIAPIMTETGGRVWRQTIFYPYFHALQYGYGKALKHVVLCDTYDASTFQQVPYLTAAVVQNGNEIIVFAVNRAQAEAMTLELDTPLHLIPIEHLALFGDDRKAVNTADCEAVQAKSLPLSDTIILPPCSWNVLRFTVQS